MTTDQIIDAVTLIGLGSIFTAIFNYFAAKRKAKHDARQSYKETRYKAIIMLSYHCVYYDHDRQLLIDKRPDINNLERLKNELHAEFINMALFASDKVILRMKEFIKKATPNTLNNLAVAMRKDLYGIRTGLKGDSFLLVQSSR